MGGVHLLEDRKRVGVLVWRNRFAQGGDDGVTVRFHTRRQPHRHRRELVHASHRFALERRAPKGSYERRKLSEVLERFRVKPSLDRIRDEC